MSSIDAQIASGWMYPIVSVNDRRPKGIDDFVGDEGTFDIELGSRQVRVHGAGTLREDGSVRFHEKDPLSTKDVRVWWIERHDGGFTAEALSATTPGKR